MFWPNKFKMDRLVGPDKTYVSFYILNITSTVPNCNGLLLGKKDKGNVVPEAEISH